MGLSRLSGPLVVGGEIFAAGTTQYKSGGTGAAGTKRSIAGKITAQSGFVSLGGLSVAGTFRATGGIGFAAGNYKKFAMGTNIGTGGATAPIISTGLTTISAIVAQRVANTGYSTATTGNVLCRPSVASGTLGSFYPIAFKHTGTAAIWALNTVSGTFKYIAVGT